MVIDSSAIIAILFEEPEGPKYVRAIEAAQARLVSTATILETTMVVAGRAGDDYIREVDDFIAEAEFTSVPFDGDHLRAARNAFLRFGKGRHAAGLNFGDCISYALARVTGEPLLFKGTDFGMTDIDIVQI